MPDPTGVTGHPALHEREHAHDVLAAALLRIPIYLGEQARELPEARGALPPPQVRGVLHSYTV